MRIMDLIIAVSIVVSSLVMVMFQFLRNYRNREQCTLRAKVIPWILLMLIFTVFVNLICHQTLSVFSLLYDVFNCICPSMLLSLTVWNGKFVLKIIALYFILDISVAGVYILYAVGMINSLSDQFYIFASLFSVAVMIAYIIWVIWRFLFNVKLVLRSGTVWNVVSASIEIVYLITIVFILSVSAGIICLGNERYAQLAYLPLIMLWFALLGLSFRINSDCAMIFCHRMERRILESLKVAVVELPNDITRTDATYQDIYDRIVAYFETEKPYLRSDLIIDDLVKVVFSNKLYISRAISQITGRNFCQFVNYYRIMYSVESFRKNPELKATELASLSGFNSLVSFSMAFRLYMNENPSDWIRKERNRKAKSGYQ